MENIQGYLEQTESAVRKLFEGLSEYHKLVLRSVSPMYLGKEGDTENKTPAYQEWSEKNQNEIQISRKAMQDSFAERFAYATLAGSLLQIAAMGIQLFSQNESIPEDLPEDIKRHIKTSAKKSPVKKFCIGRKICDIPIGLIIYAGRNQYNHIDAKKLNEVNTKIFDLISKRVNEDYSDPCFDLINPEIKTEVINFAGNIIGLLEWDHYEQYHADMLQMLTTEEITYKRPALDEFIDRLRNLLPDLKKKYGVSLLGIFGSYTRGEETPMSDLDLLVDFELNQSVGLIKICELENYLTKQLVIQVDLTLLNELKSQVSKHILSEVIYL